MSSKLQTEQLPFLRILCVAYWQIFASASPSSCMLTIYFIFLGQILTVNPTSNPGIFTITGVNGLYISLNVSLYFCIFLGGSCLTIIGFREILKAPSSPGPTRNTSGNSSWLWRRPTSKLICGLEYRINFVDRWPLLLVLFLLTEKISSGLMHFPLDHT